MDNYEQYNNININEVCRICLEKQDQMSLISQTEVVNMLFDCASVQLSEEDFSHFICVQCESEIIRWHQFKLQILKNFEIAQWLIKQDLEVDDKKIIVVKEEVEQVQSELEFVLCGYSEKQLSNGNSLYQHKEFHDVSHGCLKCGEMFLHPETLDRHMRTHDSRNYACDLCGKTFCKQFDVTEHMRSHTGERPFECEHCGRKFARKALWKSHIKKVHSEEKNYNCSECSKAFVDSYQLRDHMRAHTGEKPFPCDQCDKAFPTLGQLKSHVKYKHTREKNYVCNVCGKAFTTNHTFQEHYRIHTGEKKALRHECSTCGKKCITTTHLKNHIISAHSGERPFSCQLCDKKFITRTVLESHSRIHTGDLFECCACGKGFVTKSSLRIHERTHTGERPYKCEICSSTFTQGSTLKTHMKVHKK